MHGMGIFLHFIENKNVCACIKVRAFGALLKHIEIQHSHQNLTNDGLPVIHVTVLQLYTIFVVEKSRHINELEGESKRNHEKESIYLNHNQLRY